MVPHINTDREWIKDLEHIFKYGNRVSPRGMLVYETMAYKSTINMNTPIIYNEHRNLGYKFMAAEAAWILDGKNDVESIRPYSKDIAKFSDDGVVFFGAYGPKIIFQLPYIVETLAHDPDSRQALLNIWREKPPASKDIPCTVSLQWLIRHNTLHCVATMRSSDLWLGHPYDIFNFSAVSFYIMMHLNYHRHNSDLPPLSLGQLHLTAGSKHIYDRNTADVGMIIENYHTNGLGFDQNDKSPFVAERYERPDEFIQHLWLAADKDGGAKTMVL